MILKMGLWTNYHMWQKKYLARDLGYPVDSVMYIGTSSASGFRFFGSVFGAFSVRFSVHRQHWVPGT